MKNARADQYGIRAYVKVGGRQRTKRFKRGPDVYEKIKEWQDVTRSALRKLKTSRPKGTLAADAAKYLEHMKAVLAPSSYQSRVCEIEAWLPAFGDWLRSDITRDDVLEVRRTWLSVPRKPHGTMPRDQRPIAPKTCNHRTRALKHLWRYLDGKAEPTPLDDIPKLAEPDAAPTFVDVQTIKRVASKLTGKTRGRFMVLASTGQRPAQLKRAVAADVQLRRRLWLVRPAKGGNPIPVILTDDMVAAWRVFIAANAWGDFDGSDYARDLYAATWPKHIRPYNAKHTVAIALANAATDWEDVKDWFGHTDVKTTRIYTGQVLSRLRRTSEKLAGRIGW